MECFVVGERREARSKEDAEGVKEVVVVGQMDEWVGSDGERRRGR